MKLKKTLAAISAAAIAITSMITFSIAAGASPLQEVPKGEEKVIATATGLPFSATAQWQETYSVSIPVDPSVVNEKDTYLKVTYTEIGKFDGNSFDDYKAWDGLDGWFTFAKFYNNYNGEFEVNCIPVLSTATSTSAVSYVPISLFAVSEWNTIQGNLQNGHASSLTVSKIEIVKFEETVPGGDTGKVEEPTKNTIKFNYYRTDENYDGWGIRGWNDFGYETVDNGGDPEFVKNADGTATATLEFDAVHGDITFLVRNIQADGQWVRDPDVDRTVTTDLYVDGVAEVWMISGDRTLYTSKPEGFGKAQEEDSSSDESSDDSTPSEDESSDTSSDTSSDESKVPGETTSVDDSDDTSSDTSSDTSEDTSSDTSEDTSSDTSSDTSEDTSSDTSSDTSEDTSSDTSSETSEDTSSDTSSDTSEDTSSDTSSDTSDDTSSDTSTPDDETVKEKTVKFGPATSGAVTSDGGKACITLVNAWNTDGSEKAIFSNTDFLGAKEITVQFEVTGVKEPFKAYLVFNEQSWTTYINDLGDGNSAGTASTTIVDIDKDGVYELTLKLSEDGSFAIGENGFGFFKIKTTADMEKDGEAPFAVKVTAVTVKGDDVAIPAPYYYPTYEGEKIDKLPDLSEQETVPGDSSGKVPGDDSGKVPDESKPDDSKPDDSKPDDSKPDDSKPDDSKPDDNKGDDNSGDIDNPAPPTGVTVAFVPAAFAAAGLAIAFVIKKRK